MSILATLFSKREDRKHHPQSEGGLRPTGHIGHRRQKCYWEPIYNPSFQLDPMPWDWNLDRDSGPSGRFIPGTALHERVVPGDTFTIKDITFKNCDFQGVFRPDAILMFENCNFISCDFAYSQWHAAHFKSCTFSECSLALCSFSGCDFRECTWSKIGVASKTEMVRTVISNPRSFIQNMVSGCDPKTPSLKHSLNQWYRLHGTRAHVLRNIMISHQSAGDEHNFYETVKLHELQRSSSRMAADIYQVIFAKFPNKILYIAKLLLHGIDYILLRVFGLINNWGESASRPFLCIATCFFMFGIIYKYFPFGIKIDHPFQKSFEITFLVGYTNQLSQITNALTILQDFHVVIAIAIYSIFFATIVSKLSRAR